MLIYLDGFMDPPIEGACFYYRGLRPEPTGDPKKAMVWIDPPIVLGDRAIRRLLLESRHEEFWRADKEFRIGSDDSNVVAVLVSTPETGGRFGVRQTVVSSDLVELWMRGGYWNWFIDAMASFVRRESHPRPAIDHVEDEFELGRYVRKLRSEHQNRMLTSDQVSFLESLPGWEW